MRIEIEPASSESVKQRYWDWRAMKSRDAAQEQLDKEWAEHEAVRIRKALFTLKGFGFERFFVDGKEVLR